MEKWKLQEIRLRVCGKMETARNKVENVWKNGNCNKVDRECVGK